MTTEEARAGQIERCFGKYRSCSLDCRLKEVCRGKFREQEEERSRKRFREARYVDEMDASANHAAADFAAADSRPETSDAEILEAIDALDLSDECRTALRTLVSRKNEAENTRDALRDMLRKLGEMYVADPVGFEVLFFQVLANGNQAELAKMRGCTKQNVNKSASRGQKRLEAYRETVRQHPECRLSFRELAVFHAVELDGMTCREAAAVLGCSRETVRRVCQKLRQKGVKCAKKHPGRRKGDKKGNSRKCQGGLAMNTPKAGPPA